MNENRYQFWNVVLRYVPVYTARERKVTTAYTHTYMLELQQAVNTIDFECWLRTSVRILFIYSESE